MANQRNKQTETYTMTKLALSYRPIIFLKDHLSCRLPQMNDVLEIKALRMCVDAMYQTYSRVLNARKGSMHILGLSHHIPPPNFINFCFNLGSIHYCHTL